MNVWQMLLALTGYENKDRLRIAALELRVTDLENKLMALNDEIEVYDTDVQALINKDTLDVADRDAAKAALADQTAKLNGGEVLSADEAAKVRAIAAALHKYLNPAPAIPVDGGAGETAPVQQAS